MRAFGVHIFFSCIICIQHLYAQSFFSASSFSGKMLAHSPYNQNLDNRRSIGEQLSYLWNLPSDSSSRLKARNSYLGFSLYGLDLGDGFLNGIKSVRRNLPAMGFGTGGMIITGIQQQLNSRLGENNLTLQFGFGPMLVSKYFDPVKNPYNQAIGSRLNFGSQLKLQFAHRISTNLFLAFGAELFHISNTNFQKPNVGLNYMQGNLSFMHNIFKNSTTVDAHSTSQRSIKDLAKFQLSTRMAFRKFRTDYPINYAVMVLEADYGFKKRVPISRDHQLTHGYPTMEWRAGVNYFYEMARTLQTPDGKLLSLEARSELGVYGRAIFRMGWVDLFLDLGYYLLPPQSDRVKLLQKNKYIYNAIGSQYRISNNIFLIHRMKAHYQIADYLEMGLVYRL